MCPTDARNGLRLQGVLRTRSVALPGRAIGFSLYRMTPRAGVGATAPEPSTIARTTSGAGTFGLRYFLKSPARMITSLVGSMYARKAAAT
jgi:hypothetical protein